MTSVTVTEASSISARILTKLLATLFNLVHTLKTDACERLHPSGSLLIVTDSRSTKSRMLKKVFCVAAVAVSPQLQCQINVSMREVIQYCGDSHRWKYKTYLATVF